MVMAHRSMTLLVLRHILSSRLCQHRWPAFAGMVTFHNTVSSALNNPMTGGSQQFAFGRGTISPNSASVKANHVFPCRDNRFCGDQQ